jgi:hypothetical protein
MVVLWRPANLRPRIQELLVQSLISPENFIKIICPFHQKLFNFILRMDRHTPSHLEGVGLFTKEDVDPKPDGPEF